MTPYQTMIACGVEEAIAKEVLQRLEAQKERTTWTPAPPPELPRRNAEAVRKEEDRMRVKSEAFILLDLIAAEFRTDLKSVQCFDKTVVDRTVYCAALLRHEGMIDSAFAFISKGQ